MNNPPEADYYLPIDTARIFTRVEASRCKNLGLLLDKYPPRWALLPAQKDRGKGTWLKEIVDGNHVDANLAGQVYERWRNATEAAGAIHFSGTTDWRMVVGLGGETVLETDLTLHHLYGIPFIPGSALKGLTRAYVTKEVDTYKSDSVEKDYPDILRIFGAQEHAGTVIFFDAMPENGEFKLDLDIMNPHYPNYYSEKKIPSNDQNPNPITFLTVTRTTFRFALAPRRKDDNADVELVKDWLQKALQDYGVGGKTSAGYGSLTVKASANGAEEATAKQKNAIDPELIKAANLKQAIEAMQDASVAGQMNNYYQQWKQLTLPAAQQIVAQAIVAKVRKAGRERASADRPWYKELLEFIPKA